MKSETQSTERYAGGCLCGAVRYAFTGPIKFVAHDHCSLCRRQSGAPMVTWLGLPDESQLELLSGEQALSTFRSTPEAKRSFCGTCGSHLFFRSTRWAGEVHVTLATVDEPHDLRPTAHVFYADRAGWFEASDGLPTS